MLWWVGMMRQRRGVRICSMREGDGCVANGWCSHCVMIRTCINTKKGETTKNREKGQGQGQGQEPGKKNESQAGRA